MFAGHVGAALAFGRADRRINVGAFVAAALLLDLLLWTFVLLGWESVTLPADYARTHQAEFVFPYSHGLAASLAWSMLAGTVFHFWYPRRAAARLRGAALVGAAVFSHWILDALVHVPEMPVAGAGSMKVGLWLWRDLPVALGVEALFVGAGLYLYLGGARLSRARKISLAVLTLLLLAFTVAGMTVAPPPPSAMAMAATSCAVIGVVCALFAWLGGPAAAAAREP
jgi:hypothetical protein